MNVPAVRGIWLISPADGVTPGLWVELSTTSPGTLTGLARTAFPSVAGNDTLLTYAVKLRTAFRDLCRLAAVHQGPYFGVAPPGHYIGSDGKLYPLVIDFAITLSLLSPVTISDVIVNEAAVRSYKVGV